MSNQCNGKVRRFIDTNFEVNTQRDFDAEVTRNFEADHTEDSNTPENLNLVARNDFDGHQLAQAQGLTHKDWDNWLGNISGSFRYPAESAYVFLPNLQILKQAPALEDRLAEGSIKYITAEALEVLCRNHHKLTYGIDLRHLPAGFSLVRSNPQDENCRLDTLHYSADLARRKPQPSKFSLPFDDNDIDTERNPEIRNKIRKYQGVEKTWWDFFFKKHKQHNRNDKNLEALISVFDAFLEVLRKKSLDLYDLDENKHFLGVTNMYVAFGRMVSILNGVSARDKEEQFNELKDLDLSSTGAIKFKQDTQNSPTPATFVVSALQCTEKHYSLRRQAEFIVIKPLKKKKLSVDEGEQYKISPGIRKKGNYEVYASKSNPTIHFAERSNNNQKGFFTTLFDPKYNFTTACIIDSSTANNPSLGYANPDTYIIGLLHNKIKPHHELFVNSFDSDEEVIKKFFLALSQKSPRCSIKFYKNCLTKIQECLQVKFSELNPESRKTFFQSFIQILFNSTTGEAYSTDHNEDHLLNSFETLLDLVNNFKVCKAPGFLHGVFKVTQMILGPYTHALQLLTTFCTLNLDLPTFLKIASNVSKFAASASGTIGGLINFSIMEDLTNIKKSSDYRGLRFYSEEKLTELEARAEQSSNPLAKTIGFSITPNAMVRYIYAYKTCTEYPIHMLLSTFNFDINSINMSRVNEGIASSHKNIAAKFTSEETKKYPLKFIEIMDQAENNNGLTPELFDKFIDRLYNMTDSLITERDEKAAEIRIYELVQEQFGKNFTPDFFLIKIKELQNPKRDLTDTDRLEITSYDYSLNDDLTSIIQTINSNTYKSKRLAVFKLIAQAYNILPEADFIILIKSLGNMAKIEQTTLDDEQAYGYLITLLTEVCRKGHILYFRQLYEQPGFVEGNSGNKTQKMAIYLEHLGPWILREDIGFIKTELQPVVSSIVIKQNFSSNNGSERTNLLKSSLTSLGERCQSAALSNQTKKHILQSLQNIKKEEVDQDLIETLHEYAQILEVVISGKSESYKVQGLYQASCKNFNFSLDPKVTYSLMLHFHTKPADLMAIIHQLITTFEDGSKIQFVLEVISKLSDEKKSINDIKTFIDLINSNSEKYDAISRCYQTSPYPDIASINDWIQNTRDINRKYDSYSKKPFARNNECAFIRDEYDTQTKLFQIGKTDLFSDPLKDKFTEKLGPKGTLAKLTTVELKAKVMELQSQLESNPNDQGIKDEIFCHIIEILSRTCSQNDPNNKTNIISQEMNTTQVLAAYSILFSSQGNMMCQIDTGEGKSRVMIVAAAYKALTKKTVDLVTSNMALSERDFIAYNSFFKTLEIETSLIFSDSSPNDYKISGVNFSTPGQLSLARNAALVNQNRNKNLGDFSDQPNNSCLLLDEADATLYDAPYNKYNYALTDTDTEKMTWLYAYLVRYAEKYKDELNLKISQLNVADKDDEDDEDDENQFNSIFSEIFNKFKSEIRLYDDSSKLNYFTETNKRKKKLISLFKAALTANSMKEDVHYKISTGEPEKLTSVFTKKGIVKTREVHVLNDNRIALGSNFSGGVQQCLEARVNLEHQKAHPELDDKDIVYIRPAKKITCSSYSRTLLLRAEQFIGVTGSPLSELEKKYAEEAYNVTFIKAPRHKKFKRKDQRMIVVNSYEKQLKLIVNQITAARKSDRPILVFCENDHISNKLFFSLKNLLGDTSIQHVDSSFSADDEKKAIAQAGNPGMITVTTNMLGRGTDICAKNLLVIPTYRPEARDMAQICGRSGRFGEEGESRIIINSQDNNFPLSSWHGKKLLKWQREEEQTENAHRVLIDGFTDFIDNLTKQFFARNDHNDLLIQAWQDFLEQLYSDWQTASNTLLKQFNEDKDIQKLSDGFNSFISNLKDSYHIFNNGEDINIQLKTNVLTTKPSYKKIMINAQNNYDIADDGQASVYTSLFKQTRATLMGNRKIFANTRAWKNGQGVIFADTRALLNGDRELFANLRATIKAHKIGSVYIIVATIVTTSAVAIIMFCLQPLAPLMLVPIISIAITPKIVAGITAGVAATSLVSNTVLTSFAAKLTAPKNLNEDMRNRTIESTICSP